MSEINILFALKVEANSLLHHSSLRFEMVTKRRFEAEYNNTKINIIISGVGREQTINTLTQLCPGVDSLIIKAGSCALLSNELQLFQGYLPPFVTDGKGLIALSPQVNGGTVSPNSGVFTVEKPLTDAALHAPLLEQGAAFVEMELYYIMEHFREHPRKMALLVGSDRGDGAAFADFKANIKRVSDVLRDELMQILKAVAG